MALAGDTTTDPKNVQLLLFNSSSSLISADSGTLTSLKEYRVPALCSSVRASGSARSSGDQA